MNVPMASTHLLSDSFPYSSAIRSSAQEMVPPTMPWVFVHQRILKTILHRLAHRLADSDSSSIETVSRRVYIVVSDSES